MRLISRFFPFVALVSISFSSPSQTIPFSQRSQQAAAAHTPRPASWEQHAVYWTAEPGWKTEIHLRNNLPSQSLSVVPVLRTPEGTETALPTITVAANDIAVVDIGKAIANRTAQLAGAYGSLVFRYTAPVERALAAAVMIQLPGTPIEFHLDAFAKAPRAMLGGREGIWWLPRESVKDWLVLANTSNSLLSVALTLYESDGNSARQILVLGPRATTRLSVSSMVRQGGLLGSFGGISVDAGPRGADLDSAHFMYDEANSFLALMKMFDRDSNASVSQRSLASQQWTIRAPMLALTNPDPALALPAGTTLKPAVFLRNASPNAYTAQLTFNWRSGTSTGKRIIPVPLQPHATARVDVGALQANGTIPATAQWAYVSISAPIRPDDLLAVATSFDATLRFGAQTPFSDQAANHWAGGIWEVDTNHNTLIAVGNAGNKASKVQIVFHYNSGQSKYLVERTLEPDEQAWIDVGQLIGDQIPDVHGKTLPPSVMAGGYDVDNVTDKPTDGVFEGKLVVDKTYGYAVHGCLTCCPEYDSLYILDDPLNLSVGDSSSQTVWAYDSCHNQTVQLSPLSWDTGNHQVATASVSGVVTAVGAGSTTDIAQIRVFFPDSRGYCRWSTLPTSGQVNASCAIPTNFSSTEINLPDGTLSFQYTYQSSSGNQNDLAQCKVGETVFYPGATSPYIWPLPMVSSTFNPTALYGAGNKAFISDKNGPPSSYKQPYSYAHFQATQRLQWECPCYNSGNYNNFVPDITIDRKVFKDTDGKWKYQISKSGYTNTVVLP